MNKWKGSFPSCRISVCPQNQKGFPLNSLKFSLYILLRSMHNVTSNVLIIVASDKQQLKNSQDKLENLKKQIVFSYHKTISLIIVC